MDKFILTCWMQELWETTYKKKRDWLNRPLTEMDIAEMKNRILFINLKYQD